jgi:copper homeostasis protein (lipoprotein)
MPPGALFLGVPLAILTIETSPMRGTFTYMADAPLFEECGSGKKLPVAMEEDYLALERAYLEKRTEPGQAILARVEGRIVERVNMEGPARPTLVVARFLSLSPGESCEEPFEGTHWKLTELNGTAAVPSERRPEAHLVFQREGRMAGSDGCNRLFGSYTLEGDGIRIGKMGGTLMACAEPVRDREFRAALEKAVKWRILGGELELRSAEGELLARFEAVPGK